MARNVLVRGAMILGFGILFLLPSSAVASETDGTIDATNKYAWAENIGWLNFGTGVGAGDVHVTDAGLTGYVWSEQKGWINLAPTNSSVTIDAAGNLDGFSWGEQTGYIDFANASIDANGIFHGTATNVITGTITFDCTNCLVETDYRPADFRAGGGGGSRRRTEGEIVVEIGDVISGGVYGSAGAVTPGEGEELSLLPKMGLIDALKTLMAWMEPVDYLSLHHPSKVKIKRNLGMIMRQKHIIKLLASLSGYSDGYAYGKPAEKIQNIADLSKALMISFSECFSPAEMERALRHDFAGNDYWWAGYWHFMDAFLTAFLKKEYQMWDGVEDLHYFVLLDKFLNEFCSN